MTAIAFQRFREGVRREFPLLIGVAPFGMIYGVLVLQAGLSPVQAQAMSAVVFAGKRIGSGSFFAPFFTH